MGMALRGYWTSPRHDDRFIESHIDIRDVDGNVVPGYGWVFPLGDGRVNVGVGLLSTDRSWKGVNTTSSWTRSSHRSTRWASPTRPASVRRPAAVSHGALGRTACR